MLKQVTQLWEAKVESKLPAEWKANIWLNTFGFLKIPLMFFVRPSTLELTDSIAVIKIPLTRRSKNHLNSMYFGAIAIGADAVIGLLAMSLIRKKKGTRIQLVFKNFQADFLKRAEGDVHFVCEEGEKISRLIENALRTGERVTEVIHGYAIVPQVSSEKVAEFSLGLSLKSK
jgi:acyl-coenzyme A thioesterase PaaI-like protein